MRRKLVFTKKKSVPEKIVDFIGEQVDDHGTVVAKGLGSVLVAVAVVAVGTSAIVNTIREGGE